MVDNGRCGGNGSVEDFALAVDKDTLHGMGLVQFDFQIQIQS